MFSTQSPFVNIYDIISFAAEFEEPKIGISGKGLKFYKKYYESLLVFCIYVRLTNLGQIS